MWIASLAGFFSVVAAPHKPGMIQVRARRKADLVRLMNLCDAKETIVRSPKNDYLFRVLIPTATWLVWATKLAQTAGGYENFKDAVKQRDPARANIYSKVWETLTALEKQTAATAHSKHTCALYSSHDPNCAECVRMEEDGRRKYEVRTDTAEMWDRR